MTERIRHNRCHLCHTPTRAGCLDCYRPVCRLCEPDHVCNDATKGAPTMSRQAATQTDAAPIAMKTESDWERYHRIKAYGTVPETTSTLLTGASKMPSESWSLPAAITCPGKPKAPTSPCAHCYARNRGHYSRNTVKIAQQRRLEYTRRAMITDEGRQNWVDEMVTAIGLATQHRGPFFRVHDSGDLFNPRYVEAWAMVARALPAVWFWIPTQSHHMEALPAWSAALAQLKACPNVSLRPSTDTVDAPAPMLEGYSGGSTVATDPAALAATDARAWICPARDQGGRCGDCRACWLKPDRWIIYPIH